MARNEHISIGDIVSPVDDQSASGVVTRKVDGGHLAVQFADCVAYYAPRDLRIVHKCDLLVPSDPGSRAISR